MAIYTQTVEQIKRDVARSVSALIYNGTADSGSTSTLVHDELKRFTNDDALNGKQIDIVGGTGIGEDLDVSDFTASSGTVTVVPNFAATIDSSSRYHIYDPSIVSAKLLEELIAEAVGGLMRYRLVATSSNKLILNDVIQGWGDMETWTSTSIPDNWTASAGTITQEKSSTALVRYDSASAKIVSDGTNAAGMYFDIFPREQFGKMSLIGKCWVRSSVINRSDILMVSDNTGSITADGDGKAATDASVASVFQELVTASLPGITDPGVVRLFCRISAGGAVTTYFDGARVIANEDIWVYTIPAGLTAISEIWVEGTSEDHWSHITIPNSCWHIDRASNELVINRKRFSGYSDRRLHIRGLAALSTPDSDDDAVEVPEYVKAYCRYHILESMGGRVSIERLGFAKRIMDEEYNKARRVPIMKNLRWIER
jgi:hypothetical protein